MAPTTKTTKSEDQVKKDFDFLLACLMHLESFPWGEIANTTGITGTVAVPAGKTAQRKFKRLVDASGKFALDAGKVVLKDQPAVDDNNDDEDENDGVQAPDSPTPAPKTPAKKRGRPAGTTKGSSTKKARVAKDDDEDEENDD